MKRNYTGLKIFLIGLMLVLIAASAYLVKLCIDMVDRRPETAPSAQQQITLPTRPEETVPPTQATTVPTQPEPEKVVSTATISAQGDLLMHAPIYRNDYNTVCYQADGSYDFSCIFEYLAPYTQSYDWAMANLETTFGGPNYPIRGNPEFNTPDSFAGYIRDAGFDMLMTANNHAVDTRGDGVVRTVEVVREAGLQTLGTQLSGEEPDYSVVEINGIKVGMSCFTYGYSVSGDGTKFSLNGLAQIPDEGTVNYFMNNNLDKLYTEAQAHMDAMTAEGAEATMMFIHWGVEYITTENAKQNEIAQKLCDMGYDVIVGGHPHVVQPVELLQSTVDPEHKTVCIYSLGNAVSNQRVGISDLFPSQGYTEDGVLFSVTFEKYSDGTVYLAGADVLPTWVNKHNSTGKWEYNILPLDVERESEWTTLFDIGDNTAAAARRSYDRTMGIVGEGMTAVQDWLAGEKLEREQYYLDLVQNG